MAQLPARSDVELFEDVVQVPFDGARADEQPAGNVGVRKTLTDQPGNVGLLGGEFGNCGDVEFAGRLAGSQQFLRSALRECFMPIAVNISWANAPLFRASMRRFWRRSHSP